MRRHSKAALTLQQFNERDYTLASSKKIVPINDRSQANIKHTTLNR